MRILHHRSDFRDSMRTLLAVAFTALLLAPMGAYGEGLTVWNTARHQEDAGTFGGLTLALGNGTVDASASAEYNDLPNIVEVYTATWCMNCVTSEHAMHQATEGLDAVLIHYHRHWFEIQDPFGSNSTEERWVAAYGESSKEAGAPERAAPTSVIDGQRMHTGSAPKGTSLVDDYSQSLSVGNRAWFMGGTIDFSVDFSDATPSFTWNFDNLVFSCADDCPPQRTTPWILFVEDSANFEDGSNGLEDYLHVAHSAVQLEGTNGTAALDIPTAWDGEDMTAVLLIDWDIEHPPSPGIGSSLPAVGIASLLSMLAAVPLTRASRQD